MDRVVPYPHPDFGDADLLSKELINGSFAVAVVDDVKHFRPVLGRYEGSVDDIKMRMMAEGRFGPQAADLDMHSEGTPYLKQLAWLPYHEEDEGKDPEIIYNPTDYYTSVEYHGLSNQEVSTTFIKDIYCSTPYYDSKNPGLFGFKFIRDSDGNITDRLLAFFSLLDFSVSILGRWPDALAFDSRSPIGYVKGAAVFTAWNGGGISVASMGLDGSVRVMDVDSSLVRPLGEHGAFVAKNGTTKVYSWKFEVEADSRADFTSSNISSASSPVPYPFGVLINRAFYYPASETGSWKYRKRKEPDEYGNWWTFHFIPHAVWKAQKMVKYDYVTDNWINEPFARLNYNMLKHGVYTPAMLPMVKSGTLRLKSSDNYGDFAEIDGEDGKSLVHTFDFRKWEYVTDQRAIDRFYGMMGRIWIDIGLSDVTGYLPYTMAFFDSGDKMIFQYDGFVFTMG